MASEMISDMMHRLASTRTGAGVMRVIESLGREGQHQLQFFDTVDDLRRLLQPFFRNAYVTQIEYWIGRRRRNLRPEACWRRAPSLEYLDMAAWSPGGRGFAQ